MNFDLIDLFSLFSLFRYINYNKMLVMILLKKKIIQFI